MRRRRWQRWVVVLVVVALGLAFVLDVVAVQYLESRSSAEIARTMSAEDATVELGGFPFLPRFLRGRLTDVSVRVRGASAARGLRVSAVEARMDVARFSPREAFALARSSFATRSRVTATQPFGAFELAERDLAEFIERAVPVVGDVRIRSSGVEVRFLDEETDPDEEAAEEASDGLTEPARYLPRMVDRRLQLILTSVSQVPQRYRADAARIEELIDLPRFPEGLSAQVSLRQGVIAVEAQGAEVSFEVGEGTRPDD